MHTRSAQQQDKVEQQHLKRLVLDYEQREEAEEMKGRVAVCLGKLRNLMSVQLSRPEIVLEPSRFVMLDNPPTICAR